MACAARERECVGQPVGEWPQPRLSDIIAYVRLAPHFNHKYVSLFYWIQIDRQQTRTDHGGNRRIMRRQADEQNNHCGVRRPARDQLANRCCAVSSTANAADGAVDGTTATRGSRGCTHSFTSSALLLWPQCTTPTQGQPVRPPIRSE